MHEQIDLRTLERIFSDAQVIDVDFSLWDQVLTFCVLADHYREWSGGRCPLLLLRFHGVADFRAEFNHLEQEPLEDDAHYQWLVDSSSFERQGGNWRVRLSGSLPAAPAIELTCRMVDFEEIDHRHVDRLFPGWDRPYGGLARPGIAALIRRV